MVATDKAMVAFPHGHRRGIGVFLPVRKAAEPDPHIAHLDRARTVAYDLAIALELTVTVSDEADDFAHGRYIGDDCTK
jgi:hypothetical protein